MKASLKNFQEKMLPILQRNNVAFAGFFGSYARGDANTESDIDVLVSFSQQKSLLDLVRLERMLSEALQKRVDLVTERSLSPYIKDAVLRDLAPMYGER